MARMVTFLLGAATGYAAGYFLDPSSGRRRRHQTRDQAVVMPDLLVPAATSAPAKTTEPNGWGAIRDGPATTSTR